METVSLDLLDRGAVLNFFQDRAYNFVFHLAWKIDQAIRPEIYTDQFRVHVESTINLIEAIAGKPLTRLMHGWQQRRIRRCTLLPRRKR
jgi:nucleoside-diphosphate-sugar epimerase